MATNKDFCKYFNDKLGINNFEVFFWECPGLNQSSINKTYKHTILNAKESLHRTSANSQAFEKNNPIFNNCNKINKIVSFRNIHKDALLITPCDNDSFNDKNKFKNIANFVKAKGIDEVQKNLWQEVAKLLLEEIKNEDKTIYLNTDGRGVPWLHVRFDETDKYYETHRDIANKIKEDFPSPIEPASPQAPASPPKQKSVKEELEEAAAESPAAAAEPPPPPPPPSGTEPPAAQAKAPQPPPAAPEPPPAAPEPEKAAPEAKVAAAKVAAAKPTAAKPPSGTEAPGAVLAEPAQPPPAAHYDSNTSDNFVSNILNTDIDITNTSNIGLYMALMGLGTAVTFLIL